MSEHVEWAVETKSLIGGEYDEIDDGRGWTNRYGKPYTKQEAQERIIKWNKGMKRSFEMSDLHDPQPYARLVTRTVTDWTAEED